MGGHRLGCILGCSAKRQKGRMGSNALVFIFYKRVRLQDLKGGLNHLTWYLSQSETAPMWLAFFMSFSLTPGHFYLSLLERSAVPELNTVR